MRPPRDQNGKSKIQNRKHRSDPSLISPVLMDLPLKGSDEIVTEPEEEAAAVVMVFEATGVEVELDLMGGGKVVGGTVIAMLISVVTGAESTMIYKLALVLRGGDGRYVSMNTPLAKAAMAPTMNDGRSSPLNNWSHGPLVRHTINCLRNTSE
ncbi:hypothetical protein U1Q18_037297 [Sarracenia purpurea var. burkii]